eukprot:38771_1
MADETEPLILQALPHHIVGFIGTFVDIFDLYSIMKSSKTMHTFFISEVNHCTMKSCVRNVFDNEWLQLALVLHSNDINKAIRWLYCDTLIYRQCHSYKTTMDARNQLSHTSIADLTIVRTPKREIQKEIIGRLVTGNAVNILLQRQRQGLFHLSSLHSHESVLLLFRNGSATHTRTLKWKWVDSDGQDVDYTEAANVLLPNRAIYQPTFPSHPWKILD